MVCFVGRRCSKYFMVRMTGYRLSVEVSVTFGRDTHQFSVFGVASLDYEIYYSY
jgi:hypothetical protein